MGLVRFHTGGGPWQWGSAAALTRLFPPPWHLLRVWVYVVVRDMQSKYEKGYSKACNQREVLVIEKHGVGGEP